MLGVYLIQTYRFLFTKTSLEIPFHKLVFPSKGPNISRVLFKPASRLCYPLSRPSFWKPCSFSWKHPSLLSHNRRVILETCRESAVGNQAFLWGLSFERWELEWGNLHRKYHEGISSMCSAHISIQQILAAHLNLSLCTLITSAIQKQQPASFFLLREGDMKVCPPSALILESANGKASLCFAQTTAFSGVMFYCSVCCSSMQSETICVSKQLLSTSGVMQ